MAVLIPRYDVTNNPNLKGIGDYALGLDLPLQMGTKTFVQNYDYILQLKANVTNLLRTQQGERLMQPLFGTKLRQILFEPFDESIEDKIFEAIDTAVRVWVPELTIANIEVNQDNKLKDKNTVEIKVAFNVNSSNASFVTVFNMNSNN